MKQIAALGLMAAAITFSIALCAAPAFAQESSFGPGDGRVVLLPTAQIMEQGAHSVSNYELLTFHFSYGATDDTQFSVLVTAPVAQLGVLPSIKHRIINEEHLKVAVMAYGGGMIVYTGSDIMAFTAGAGVIADWCIDDECRKIVSLSAQPGFGMAYDRGSSHNDSSTEYGFSFYAGPGLTLELSDSVKLVAEVAYAMIGNPGVSSTVCPAASSGDYKQACHEETFTRTMGILSFDYALRIHGRSFSSDLGFVRPLLIHNGTSVESVEEVMKYLPIGFPWLSFTYQW